MLVIVVVPARRRALDAADAPAGAWQRPVPGAVARPFVEPVSRYGAGHRGADLVAPPGTPVRAANAGEVSFAGPVAGALHVVVAHAGGLRTSYSFLASVAVRRGQRVGRGRRRRHRRRGTGEHAGVLHLGLRIGERYVDPMRLFAPADLTRLIRLVPVDEPDQRGLDPPALERRSLAESLHLPLGVPGPKPSRGDDGLLAAAAGALGGAVGEVGALASRVVAPAGRSLGVLGAIAGEAWRRTPGAALLTDAGRDRGRLVAWARGRADCVEDASAPPGGGGSGHRVLAVAGIGSRTDPRTGATSALDVARLGYRSGEVRHFSYAPDGGAYGPGMTTGDIRVAARRLRTELRALERAEPGREVDLVGHSLGGAVVVEFLSHHYDPADPTLPPIGTVVTLAAPLRGTPAAGAATRVRETRTGRRVLDAIERTRTGVPPKTGTTAAASSRSAPGSAAALQTRPLPEQIDLTAFGAVDDVVVPADHTARPGARPVTVNPAGVADHARVLEDPRALDAVRLALEGRGAPCIGLVDGVRGAVEPVLVSRAERVAGEAGRAAGRVADEISDWGGSP